MDWIWFVIIVLIILLAERITEKRISNLQVHFDYMASNFRNQREEISALKTQLNNAFSTLGRLTSKFTSFQNNLEKKISDLRDNMDSVRSTSHAQQETQISTSFSQPEPNISTLQSQMDSRISTSHNKLKIEISSLKNKMEDINSDLDARIQTLRSASTDQLEAQIYILQNKFEANKSDLQAQLETMNSTSNSKMYSLENSISGLLTLDQLDTKISTLKNAQEEKSAELETKLDQLNVKISDLQRTLETTSSDFQSKLENISSTCIDQLDTRMSIQDAQLATTSDLQQKSTDAQTDPVVSFFVNGISRNLISLTNGTVNFQEVISNIGGAYNPDTRVFICPVSGFYHLSVALHSLISATGEFALCAGTVLQKLTINSTYDALSFSGEFHLKAGDKVCVKMLCMGVSCSWYDGENSFSGHLIIKL